MIFRMVYKSGQIFLPFCHNPRMWRTDGRTDRQTEFSSLDRVCIPCSAVIIRDRLRTGGSASWSQIWRRLCSMRGGSETDVTVSASSLTRDVKACIPVRLPYHTPCTVRPIKAGFLLSRGKPSTLMMHGWWAERLYVILPPVKTFQYNALLHLVNDQYSIINSVLMSAHNRLYPIVLNTVASCLYNAMTLSPRTVIAMHLCIDSLSRINSFAPIK